MKKATATLYVELDIRCPYCGNDNNLDSNDRDNFYMNLLFDGRNDSLTNETVHCDMCEKKFRISEVDY